MSNSRDKNKKFSPTTEERVVLHLLAVSIGSKLPPLSEEDRRTVDWERVMRESIQQSVSPMVFEAASAYEADIHPAIYRHWFSLVYAHLCHTHRVLRSQEYLVDLMKRANHPFVILKGTSAAMYYPDPEKRCFGDVDFLIDPAEREAVEKLLEDDGYNRCGMKHICHVVYRRDYEHLEMHFEIAGIPFGEAGERVREYFRGIERRPLMQTINGAEFPGTHPRDHAMIILLHMQHHMLGDGIGLRHLCDWGAFLNRTADEPFWETDVLPFVREIGLMTYMKTMTKTAALYLGTVCPEWAKDADEDLCADVVADMYANGNFGRKDGLRSKSAMLIAENGKAGTQHGMVYNLAHTLHGAVMVQYPIVRRIPILYPFLYVYKVIRFLILRACGKRLPLMARIPYAVQRKNLYQQLKVFEPQEDEVEK